MTPCTLPHFHCHSKSREVLCAETAELILVWGASELWQHPGDVGPGKSQSLLAINRVPSKTGTQRSWTAAHLWLLSKADIHLCGVKYRARMYSQSSLSIGQHWTQPWQWLKPACDLAVSYCTECQSIVPVYLYSPSPKNIKLSLYKWKTLIGKYQVDFSLNF